MADRKVKRNTSKQIISYTLDPEGTDSYGNVKLAASKTVYGKDAFNKVLYTPPTELVNADPSLELTIINEEKLDLRNFTGFKDEFSARYELPPNDKKYYSYNQSYESTNGEKPYGSGNLGFSKVVFGPPQATPGRYTITKELIDSGNDLKLTYQIRSFDKREPVFPKVTKVPRSGVFGVSADGITRRAIALDAGEFNLDWMMDYYYGFSSQQATAYLDRYKDLRLSANVANRRDENEKGNYSPFQLMKAMQHWYEYGGPDSAFTGQRKGTRYILLPVSIDTRFQRIRKSSAETSINSFGIRNTVTNFDADVGLGNRPTKSNGFNHVNGITILNEDMKEFDEWQIAGSCGTANNDEVGYYVDSSFWDIQLISN
jgi:hypothetical protein